MIGTFQMWIWDMEVAMLFLTLASVMMRAWEKILKDLIAILSSYWTWDLRFTLLCLLDKWNEKQLENVSIILHPGASSGLRGSKEENTSLKQLFILITRPLISLHWHFERKPRDNK